MPRPKGGYWSCTGMEDRVKSTDDDQIWLAGSTCMIKCKSSTRVGICGPQDKYPMDDPTKQPGRTRCLQNGDWSHYPICKVYKIKQLNFIFQNKKISFSARKMIAKPRKVYSQKRNFWTAPVTIVLILIQLKKPKLRKRGKNITR